MDLDHKSLLKLDSIIGSPYFTTGVSNTLKQILSKYQNIELVEDELAIYVKIGNRSLPPFIVDTHLDHPGFVVGTDNFVHSLGSFVNSKMINHPSFLEKIPVEFYTPNGMPLTKGYIFDNKIENNQVKSRYFAENFLQLPVNTQVFPIISTGKKGDYFHLRAADNIATVSVCLSLIESLHDSPDCNLTFVFTKLEEIYQISATGIANRGRTPFESILKHTPILVLEVAPVLTKTQSDNGDLAIASSENVFETLNPNSALLKSIKTVCQSKKTNLHFVSIHSHGNSISYRLVAKNTETICLALGNFNRHNIDSIGHFAPEIVSVKSISQMIQVVHGVIQNITKNYPKEGVGLSLTKQEIKKRRQLLTAYLRAYPRLKFQKLYPQSILEYLFFASYSILSRFYRP